MKPLATNCRDHAGARSARIQQWDGTKWVFTSDFYEADNQIIKPMIKAAAQRYVTEKKLTMRSCADEIAADAKSRHRLPQLPPQSRRRRHRRRSRRTITAWPAASCGRLCEVLTA